AGGSPKISTHSQRRSRTRHVLKTQKLATFLSHMVASRRHMISLMMPAAAVRSFAASANSSRPISSLCRWSSRGIAQAVRLSATGCVTCVGCGELLAVTGSCVLKRRMILTSAVAPTAAFVSDSGAEPSWKVCSSSCASMSTTDRNTAMLNQLVSDIHHGFAFTTMVSCMASASVVGARAHQYAQLSDRLRQHLHLAAQPGKPLAAVLTQRLQLNLQLAGHVFSRVGARPGHFGDALRSSHTLADALPVPAPGPPAG